MSAVCLSFARVRVSRVERRSSSVEYIHTVICTEKTKLGVVVFLHS